MTTEDFDGGVLYAFGHLVSSNGVDAHAADSGSEADDVMEGLGLTARERAIMELLAEHVSGNYDYTGEADDFLRRVREGEA
jgi:hypothetical protein